LMKEGARIKIIGFTLSFNPAYIVEELAVDETIQHSRSLT